MYLFENSRECDSLRAVVALGASSLGLQLSGAVSRYKMLKLPKTGQRTSLDLCRIAEGCGRVFAPSITFYTRRGHSIEKPTPGT